MTEGTLNQAQQNCLAAQLWALEAVEQVDITAQIPSTASGVLYVLYVDALLKRCLALASPSPGEEEMAMLHAILDAMHP